MKGVVQVLSNIDVEFEEFVRKNYRKLTDTEKNICRQLGVIVPA